MEHALRAASLGIPVFRIMPNSKKPLRQGWQHEATTDAATVRRLWGATPNANIGWAMGGGLCALDVDNKNGKCGDFALAGLQCDHGFLPPTLVNETPTGGRHLILRTDSDVSNSAGRLGDGLDVRGRGGYVVGAGSVINGKAYRAEDAQIAQAPRWFCSLAGRPLEKQDSTPLVEQDTPDAIGRARAYLLKEAPVAIEGAGGDNTTVQVAMRLRDLAVSETAALEMLLDHWNDRCSPPWMPDELERKVANAYRYAKLAPGNADPMADFEPIEMGGDSPISLFGHPVQALDEVTLDLEDRYVVEGLLDQDAISVIYGLPNSGKSLLALDIAWHVATGQAWAGRDVQQGAALVLALEGRLGTTRRLKALCRSRPAPESEPPLYIWNGFLDLRQRSTAKAIIEAARRIEAQRRCPVRLVVIDTLARAMPGADENSGQDMGETIATVDRIRSALNCHVCLVHHAGKDSARGARGHSSLAAAVDQILKIEKNGAVRRIRPEKMRDQEVSSGAIKFAVEGVTLGPSPQGKVVTAPVVRVLSGAEDEFAAAQEPTGKAGQSLDTLRDLIAASASAKGGGREPGWVALADWKAACLAEGTLSGTGDAVEKAWQRIRHGLSTSGWVEIVGDQVHMLRADTGH